LRGASALWAPRRSSIIDHRLDLSIVGARVYSEAKNVRSASVATAMQVLAAVPAVCAAPPGFATMADLPLLKSPIGFGHG